MFLAWGCAAPQVMPHPPTMKEALGGLVPNAEEPKAPTVVLHVDTDFTSEERAEMEDAAAIWYVQTSHLAVIALVYDLDFSDMANLKAHVDADDNLVARMESWMRAVQEGDQPHAMVLGWVSPGGGIHNPEHAPTHVAFVTDRFLDRDMALQVITHEFGHVLGLPHVASRQSIMYPSINRGRKVCLKKADLTAFCEVNECGTVRMLPCE